MAEVYALREHCINFKRGFNMGKDLQQQSSVLLEEALVDWESSQLSLRQ